jgi:ribosome maturation factor RimP
MTRFEDVTPEDQRAFSRAVGHAVRVTHTNGQVLFGRLEAFEDNTLLLEVHSGVEGGGVQFSKTIPLVMIRELRVFEAERPSETVLGQ